ncbi:MAG: collagenase, partial [Sarcina sp.]
FINGSRLINLDVNGVNTGMPIMFPTQSNGKYTIKNIPLNIGQNTLKFYGANNSMAPDLGRFNLVLNKIPMQAVLPTPSNYNVTSAVLAGGATLNPSRDLVVSLGGVKSGSATVTVDVREDGEYDLNLTFQSGGRPLRILVNGVSTGRDYVTPVGRRGVFTTVISLISGKNTIKFYGNGKDKASNLGAFTLTKIQSPSIPSLVLYNTINGFFENNVTIDNITNFTTNIGGIAGGAITMTVNVGKVGNYSLELEYLSSQGDSNLNVDINGVNVGLYNFPRTAGSNYSDLLIYDLKVYLNAGNNIIKFYGDKVKDAPMLGRFSLTFVTATKPPTPSTQNPSYTFKQLNALNYKDLVSVLKSIEWRDIPELFTFSSESQTFFSDMNRFQAIIDELRESGRKFTDSSEEGIDTLVEVLRAGYYLGYNNTQLRQLKTLASKDRCLPAIKEVMKNSYFKFGTETQDRVILAIGKLVGNASLDNEILRGFVVLINDFINNTASYNTEYYKKEAMFKIMRESEYFLNSSIYRNNNDVTSTPYYDKIDNFIGALENLLKASGNSKDPTITLNCIYVLGRLSRFKSHKGSIHQALTDCISLYQKYSHQYYEVLTSLKNDFNGKFADGSPINYDEKINEGKNHYLPNIYKFDNGNFIIRTGNGVTVEKVKRLYWAAKEVRAQFIRMVGSDQPLAFGNADDILTTIVYNSPEEYKVNLRLYGHDVKNGGIYIESEGTFYTYERTAKQSVFSLEELFRHEYNHYLQGRYLIPGLWGKGHFYSNGVEKLTWYDEGNAEFFAGSTRTEGVKPRQTIINYLTDGVLPSVATVLRSKYDSSNFYNTSCALFL